MTRSRSESREACFPLIHVRAALGFAQAAEAKLFQSSYVYSLCIYQVGLSDSAVRSVVWVCCTIGLADVFTGCSFTFASGCLTSACPMAAAYGPQSQMLSQWPGLILGSPCWLVTGEMS